MGDWREFLNTLSEEEGSKQPPVADFLKRAGTFTDIAGKTTFAKESPTRVTVERGLTNITLGAYPHLKAAVQSVQRGIPYAEALAETRISQEANEQIFPKSTMAGDIASLAIPSGAISMLQRAERIPAISNIAKRAMTIEKESPVIANAIRGGISGLTGGIRADQEISGEPALSFDPMSPITGAATVAGISKIPSAAGYAADKLGKATRKGVEILTNTSPGLGEMVSKKHDIYREVSQPGYQSSPEIAQEGIRYIEQVLGKEAKPFVESRKFRDEAEQLANTSIPKIDLLKNLKSIKNKYTTKQDSETNAQVNAIYNEYRKYILSGDRKIPASPPDVMTWVQDLQSKAKKKTPSTYSSMPTATPTATKFTKNLASGLSKNLEQYNPGYKEKMAKSSKYAAKGEAIKKYLGNTNDPRQYEFGEIPIDPQKVGNIFFSRTKVPGIAEKRSVAEKYLTSPRYMNPEQTSKLKDIQDKYLMKKELEARTASGARNTLAGTIGGISSSYMASRILDTDPVYTALTMGAIGSTMGGAIDRYGAPIAGKIYSGMNKASDISKQAIDSAKVINSAFRAEFPREYKVLSDAISRGKKRYASTLFIMQQSNPEFNKFVNEMKDRDEQ